MKTVNYRSSLEIAVEAEKACLPSLLHQCVR